MALTEERSPNPIEALPDGSGFIFERVIDGQPQLWQQRWDNLAPTPVPGTENGSTPVVSPDGTELAFIVGAELRIAPVGGGVVRTVADSANCCPRWGPDGFVYYTGLGNTIHRVPEAGGASEQVTDRDEEGDGPQADFQVLPDGENAVFSVWGNPFRVDAMNLSSGERKTLVPGVKPYLTPTGHLIFGSMEGQILAVAFDTDAAEIIGSPVPLVEGIFVDPNSYPLFSVSENGTLVYWSGASGQAGVMQMVRVTRSGEATPIDPGWTFSRGDVNTSWSISPDGTQLALREQTDQTLDIWIKQLPDGPRSRLTFDGRRGLFAGVVARWSDRHVRLRRRSDSAETYSPRRRTVPGPPSSWQTSKAVWLKPPGALTVSGLCFALRRVPAPYSVAISSPSGRARTVSPNH